MRRFLSTYNRSMSTRPTETRVDPYGLNGARPLQYGPLPERIRHRFPIFKERVYINSCSQGALSDAVRASYEQYL